MNLLNKQIYQRYFEFLKIVLFQISFFLMCSSVVCAGPLDGPMSYWEGFLFAGYMHLFIFFTQPLFMFSFIGCLIFQFFIFFLKNQLKISRNLLIIIVICCIAFVILCSLIIFHNIVFIVSAVVIPMMIFVTMVFGFFKLIRRRSKFFFILGKGNIFKKILLHFLNVIIFLISLLGGYLILYTLIYCVLQLMHVE